MLSVLHYEFFFFFNDTATPEIYTLSLHASLPISPGPGAAGWYRLSHLPRPRSRGTALRPRCHHSRGQRGRRAVRSEEHTSELQSRQYLVCRLLLEKKKRLHYEISYKR